MKISTLRKKFITGEPVQAKYLYLLMVSMLVPVIFVCGCLYFLIFNVMARQIGIPEYVAYGLMPVIREINLILLVGFPPLAILLFVWGVMLSHRFAGPLERLKRDMDTISREGDYKMRLKVRKHDDIKPLADAINKVLDRVCEGKAK